MSIPTPERTFVDALERRGMRPAIAERAASRLGQLEAALAAARPEGVAADAWFVPGRIEVLGKHTDYGGGRSLICAVERGLCAVSAARDDARVVITDRRRGLTVTIEPDGAAPSLSWANYPNTVVERLRRNFPGAVTGVDIVFDSDLPSASGMSSSSALMVLVLLAVARASRLDARDEWRQSIGSAEDLAAYAATIENGSGFRGLASERGVGTRGGSEDHTAILCSESDRLGQYSYRPTRLERRVALPDDWVFAIAVSGVRAQKTGNARESYNRAAERAARVVELWRQASGRADETLAEAVASAPGAEAEIRALLTEPALLDRFEQFIEESHVLVPGATDCIERGDGTALGAIVARSQMLAESRLGNQVPQTAGLARLAREQGALAASAFGAGFGGSVWAVVPARGAAGFLDRWQNAYRRAFPESSTAATFFLSRPGTRAIEVTSGDSHA
jgi:galactokinase